MLGLLIHKVSHESVTSQAINGNVHFTMGLNITNIQSRIAMHSQVCTIEDIENTQ